MFLLEPFRFLGVIGEFDGPALVGRKCAGKNIPGLEDSQQFTLKATKFGAFYYLVNLIFSYNIPEGFPLELIKSIKLYASLYCPDAVVLEDGLVKFDFNTHDEWWTEGSGYEYEVAWHRYLYGMTLFAERYQLGAKFTWPASPPSESFVITPINHLKKLETGFKIITGAYARPSMYRVGGNLLINIAFMPKDIGHTASLICNLAQTQLEIEFEEHLPGTTGFCLGIEPAKGLAKFFGDLATVNPSWVRVVDSARTVRYFGLLTDVENEVETNYIDYARVPFYSDELVHTIPGWLTGGLEPIEHQYPTHFHLNETISFPSVTEVVSDITGWGIFDLDIDGTLLLKGSFRDPVVFTPGMQPSLLEGSLDFVANWSSYPTYCVILHGVLNEKFLKLLMGGQKKNLNSHLMVIVRLLIRIL